MAHQPTDPFPAEPLVLALAQTATQLAAGPINAAIKNILDTPRVARAAREMVTWKTPHMGYVQMYINPQMIKIDSSKVIKNERTKGGFVIQYGGENLDIITIQGTTGSSGIEGINILQAIYRSEQLAFEGIAAGLEEQLSNVQLDQTIGSIITQFGASGSVTGNNFLFGQNVLQITSQLFNGLNKPRPTLASLAANIDMFFQGVLYRGYFETFSVTEQAGKPGWFEYDLKFMAYARQGVRRNFMPWHRQPEGPSGHYSNPLSFTEMNVQLPLPPPASTGNTAGGRDTSLSKDIFNSSSPRSSAASFNGLNIQGLDLRR